LIAYGVGAPPATQQPLFLNVNGRSFDLPGSFGLLSANNIWTGSNSWSGASTFTGTITSSGTNAWTGANAFTLGSLTIGSPITDTGVNTWSGGNTFQTIGTTFTSGITSSGTNAWSGANTFTTGLLTISSNVASSGANTWMGVNTFSSSDLNLAGSSSGVTTLNASAVASGIATLPANTGTIAELNLVQTWTAAQTFNNSDIKLLGSSTGATTFTSANSGSSNYTLTLPAATDTVAVLGTAQTFSASETFSGQIIPAYGTPTIASGACGTGSNGTIASGGTNQAGQVQIGSVATTACTVSFSTTLGIAPKACVLFPANATAAATGTTVAYVSSITTGQFVITGSALANANYYYHCL
jgi:hypothetical protein